MDLAGKNLPALLSFQARVQQRAIAGLLVPAPYYIQPCQQGLEAHFSAIASAASVPVILYDIPARTSARIDRDTLLRIVRHPHITAVKDCRGELATTLVLIADGHVNVNVNVDVDVDVLGGNDTEMFSTLSLDGHGVISASAHIGASRFVQMYNHAKGNDWEGARATFYSLLPWIELAFSEPNPAVTKGALAMQQLIAPALRVPMQACSPSTLVRVTEMLEG